MDAADIVVDEALAADVGIVVGVVVAVDDNGLVVASDGISDLPFPVYLRWIYKDLSQKLAMVYHLEVISQEI